MAQEQINGFKKVTQSYGNQSLSTEFDGSETAYVTGSNYILSVPALQTTSIVQGFGDYHPFTFQQGLYEWSNENEIYAYDAGDDVLIYNGESSVPNVNPFAKIFGDEFQNCVVHLCGMTIYGNGTDADNYIQPSMEIVATHGFPADNTITRSLGVVRSKTIMPVSFNANDTLVRTFAANSEIRLRVSSMNTDFGSPTDADHFYRVHFTLRCQKLQF